VFDYQGNYLRQIGGEGVSNFPIGVGITANGDVAIADNHNNFNLTVFGQSGQLVGALESKVKHAQCFDMALMKDGSIVLASKDYRLYIYRYVKVQVTSFSNCLLIIRKLFLNLVLRFQATDPEIKAATSPRTLIIHPFS
jgi:hypothetical protein